MKKKTKDTIASILSMIAFFGLLIGWSIYSISAWADKVQYPTINNIPWWAYLSIAAIVGLALGKYKPHHAWPRAIGSAAAALGFALGNSISLRYGIELFRGLAVPGPFSTALFFTITTLLLSIIFFTIAYGATVWFYMKISTFIENVFCKSNGLNSEHLK